MHTHVLYAIYIYACIRRRKLGHMCIRVGVPKHVDAYHSKYTGNNKNDTRIAGSCWVPVRQLLL